MYINSKSGGCCRFCHFNFFDRSIYEQIASVNTRCVSNKLPKIHWHMEEGLLKPMRHRTNIKLLAKREVCRFSHKDIMTVQIKENFNDNLLNSHTFLFIFFLCQLSAFVFMWNSYEHVRALIPYPFECSSIDRTLILTRVSNC